MLAPVLKKNDKNARLLIFTLSFVVFAAVTVLANFKPFKDVNFGFNVHIFALINAGKC